MKEQIQKNGWDVTCVKVVNDKQFNFLLNWLDSCRNASLETGWPCPVIDKAIITMKRMKQSNRQVY